MHVPHVPMLKERNVRTGFFDREQTDRILAHLPAAIRPAVQFAYITGWRIPSEVLKLQWRHVDFEARVVRLDPHTTKNDEGRTFPFTDALERLLEAQKAARTAEGRSRNCQWVLNRSNRKALCGSLDLPTEARSLLIQPTFALRAMAGNLRMDGVRRLEAPPGFEPGMEVLQTSALPLGDGAGWNT
jgi:integrase